MDDLRHHRIRRLVERTRRLAATHGNGPQAFEALRREVAGELMADPAMPTVAGALRALEGDPAQSYLEQVVAYARQFYHEDHQVLAAIVIPLAIRLHAARDEQVILSEGLEDPVSSMAMFLQRHSNADRVEIDPRLYAAQDILDAGMARRREFLLGLIGDAKARSPLGPGRPIRARVNPHTEIRYFLGAMAYRPGVFLDLEHYDTQKDLERFMWLPEPCMAYYSPGYWLLGIRSHTRCLGYYFAHQGVQVGEDHARSDELRDFLGRVLIDGVPTALHLSVDPHEGCIRLLAVREEEGAEFLWKTVAHESPARACEMIRLVVANCLPAIEVLEQPLDDYSRQARLLGCAWVPDRSMVPGGPWPGYETVPPGCTVVA